MKSHTNWLVVFLKKLEISHKITRFGHVPQTPIRQANPGPEPYWGVASITSITLPLSHSDSQRPNRPASNAAMCFVHNTHHDLFVCPSTAIRAWLGLELVLRSGRLAISCRALPCARIALAHIERIRNRTQ